MPAHRRHDPAERRASLRASALLAWGWWSATPANGQGQTAASAPPTPPAPLFLAQLSLGPAWDAQKPPQEQTGFREHSANLARMRRSGTLLFGARTSAKGWMILTAADLEAARREFADDPMVQAKAFALELEPLQPFFRGGIGAARS